MRVVTQLAGGGDPPQQLPLTSPATRRAPAAAGPGHLDYLHPLSSPLRFHHRLAQNLVNHQNGDGGSASWPPTRVGARAENTSAQKLTGVYAVSQRDFSFEFRLRDYFFLGGSLSKGIRIYTLPILDSAMRLREKAAPPRTPEQLAELGKYSGRSLQAG